MNFFKSSNATIRKRIGQLGKICKIVKLTVLFMMLGLLQVSASGYSQNAVFSISSKSISLQELFEKIEKTSEYKFFYNNNNVETDTEVRLDCKDQAIDEILDAVLEELPYSYKMLENNLILIHQKEPQEKRGVQEIEKRTITGKVVDKAGMSLPGVSIIVKGTINGVITNIDGEYSIPNVTDGNVLVYSFVGMKAQEITVLGQTNIDVVLENENIDIKEVVVTALGIKKELKRVGYAVQVVDGKSIQTAKTSNVIENLTGKVAGVTVANSNEFFSDPQIYIRGKKPLLVIDGVPVGADGWNFSADDVESINILKGPASAALYGSQGLNGAIQVTMKKGSSQEKNKTVVSVNTNNTFQTSFIRIPSVQTEYGPGSRGRYEYVDGKGSGINDSDYDIWGPKFDGRLLPQWDSPIDPETGERIPTPWVSKGKDNLKNYMETGHTGIYNVSVKNSGKYGSILFSDTYKRIKGTTPNTKLDVNTFRVVGDLNITEKLNFEGSIQYNTQKTDNIPRTTYGPTSPIYTISVWGGTHWDIRDMRDYWVEGKEGLQQKFVESWRYNNPYFTAYERERSFDKSGVIAYGKLNYKISDNMNAFVRHHVNGYSLVKEDKIPFSMYTYGTSHRKGQYSIENYKRSRSNTDFLFNYNKKFLNDQLEFSASAGGNMLNYEYKESIAETTQLVIPGLYTLQNSKEKIRPTSELKKKRVYSLYAYADIAYKDYVYLNATFRRDKSSTLPANNDAFNYPSISLSTVLSNYISMPKFITYMKLRGAYAKVGDDLDVYDSVSTYETVDDTYGKPYTKRNVPYVSTSSTLIDSNIEPAFNSSYEAGLDFRFFNNRLGFDITYYDLINGPQIYKQSISGATGYGHFRTNGRKYRRYGVEVIMTAKPIKTKNFTWDFLLNWDMNRETLKSLPDNLDGTPNLVDGRIEIGDRTDAYYYYNWQKTKDGELVIGDDGLPMRTEHKYLQGYYEPDWTFGLTNNLTYKNIKLSFLIDGRVGGFIFDNLNRDLWRSGSHPDAVGEERELGNQGVAAVLVPGKVVVSGEATYTNDGELISDTRVFADNTEKVFFQDWAKYYKADWPSNTIEKTFIKLREVSLTYNFTPKMLKNTFLESASLSLVGRNLLYWTKDDTYADLDTFTFNDGAYYRDESDLQLPSMRTFGISLNATF